MWEAARRVVEAGDEWSKMRREARVACGGILGDGSNKGKGKEVQVGEGEEKRAATEELEGAERKRARAEESQYPFGVYEPHTGLVHCMSILLLLFAFTIFFFPCFQIAQTRSLLAAVGNRLHSGGCFGERRRGMGLGLLHGSIRTSNCPSQKS
jgi:hypothetical protein